MTWFKVDDSFYDHPKVFDAPDCAVALWTRAGTWSARNLTDGFVPANLPARLCDDPDTAVRQLIDRGLWKKTRGGYRFHDWGDYQPTADNVRELKRKRAEAGRIGGQAKAAKQTASKSQASASDVGKQNSAPTRPDPSRTSGHLGEGNSPKQRASEPPTPENLEGTRPADRCPRHLHDEHPPPCGPCADARRAAEQWDTAETARAAQIARDIEHACADPRMRCEHGADGGKFLHPITGKSATCAICRRRAEREAS